MTYALAGVAVLMFLLREVQAHQHRRDLMLLRNAYAKEISDSRNELAASSLAHRQEIQQMCQRIQAPEIAVLEHQQQNVPDQPSMPLTDEQIAEQQELASVIAQMERIENEGLVT